MYTYLPLSADAHGAVASLLERAFGPGRFARTAYLVREGVSPLFDLCFGAYDGQQLVGSIEFTPVRVDRHRLLLLGPLAVDPDLQGQGIGQALLAKGLASARETSAVGTVLVGDMPYYGRFGFNMLPAGGLTLPGPVDPQRLLGLDHEQGILAELKGPLIGGWAEL